MATMDTIPIAFLVATLFALFTNVSVSRRQQVTMMDTIPIAFLVATLFALFTNVSVSRRQHVAMMDSVPIAFRIARAIYQCCGSGYLDPD